jgi:hypothetical protein
VYFKRIWGELGKIDVPAVGLLVGEMTRWDLQRREEISPGKGEYDLRASFSTLSGWMLSDPSLRTRIVIEIGRGQQYRLDADDDARTVLDGRSLLIEGVKLCRLEA